MPAPATVTAAAPTRICDLGGWTDTWFAVHGAVCHLAVWPGIEVTLTPGTGTAGVEVWVDEAPAPWVWHPGQAPVDAPFPLLAATLDEVAPGSWPGDGPLVMRVHAGVPAGASMGTSAATCVAVLRAFARLRGTPHSMAKLAARAHAIETGRLGWQSGVQDQWAGADDAVHLLEVRYPHVTCRTVPLTPGVRARLEATLLVLWLGRGHSSTAVHDQVVAALRDAGPDDPRLEALRGLAREGAAALACGDLEAYGACLTRNTELQRQLHPALVSEDAARLVDVAAHQGALGWKINGAGGDGGTLTLLCRDPQQRAHLAATWASDACVRVLPVTLAGGR